MSKNTNGAVLHYIFKRWPYFSSFRRYKRTARNVSYTKEAHSLPSVDPKCAACGSRCDSVLHRSLLNAPSTRVARAYSSPVKLELYFWARVGLLEKNLQTSNSDKNWQTSCQTFVTQLRDKFSIAWWKDTNQFKDCPVQLVVLKHLAREPHEYPPTVYSSRN